jgi:hypothetical protein
MRRMNMAERTVKDTQGREYNVQSDGTLKETSSGGAGIIGALIDSATNVVESLVGAVHPSSK